MKHFRIIVRIVLLVLVVLGIALVFYNRDVFSAEDLQEQLAGLGAWAPVILILIWLAAPVLFVPGGPITLVAGFLFGPVAGAAYSLVGATAGATLAFMLARYMGGDWVERRAKGRMAQLKAGVESEGWRFVAFVRLVPLFPFNLLNYALGLTRIPLATYSLTSLVSMAPGSFGYAYLGYAGRETILGAEDWVKTGGIAVGVLAALVLLPLMIRHWRSHRTVSPASLAEWLRKGRDVQVVDVRSDQEYHGSQGHIEPSVLIPIDDLEMRLEELEPFRGKPIVIV